MQIQAKTQNNRNLKKEKEIFKFNFSNIEYSGEY